MSISHRTAAYLQHRHLQPHRPRMLPPLPPQDTPAPADRTTISARGSGQLPRGACVVMTVDPQRIDPPQASPMKNTRSTSGLRARTRELGYADAMADVFRHTRRLLCRDEAGAAAIAEEIMQYASPFFSGRRITGHEIHVASQAERIETQITRLTEIADDIYRWKFTAEQFIELGRILEREARHDRMKKTSAPARKPPKSHLNVVE
jgi:hypothetical protein